MRDDDQTDAHESEPVNDRSTLESEWGDDLPPITAIAEAIASATNRNPIHIPPLYESVDTDALERLVTSGTNDPYETIRITFPYENHTVLVEDDGTIEIRLDTVVSDL